MPPKIFDIVSFKTYLSFPVQPKINRNLFQNSLALSLYKASLPPLDIHLINIIRGGLLGDLTGIRRSNAPTDSLKIEQKLDKFQYVDHLYSVFYDFVGSPPSVRYIKGGGAADRQSYWFRTYGHKELAKIISPFYQFNSSEGKLVKIIPNDIDQWFNECVLAYWFLDDGSLSNKTYYLNTQSYTLQDQHKLQNALKTLHINCSIKKDKISNGITLYRLEINKDSSLLFSSLIKLYVLPIFHYKLLPP